MGVDCGNGGGDGVGGVVGVVGVRKERGMSEYRFIESVNAKELEMRVNALSADGFVVKFVTQSEGHFAMHYLVCMERQASHD